MRNACCKDESHGGIRQGEEEEGEGEGTGAGAGAMGEQESRHEGKEGLQEDGGVTVRGRGERVRASVSATMGNAATVLN